MTVFAICLSRPYSEAGACAESGVVFAFIRSYNAIPLKKSEWTGK